MLMIAVLSFWSFNAFYNIKWESLHALSLRDNEISSIEANAFVHFDNLINLDVTNNKIFALEPGVFDSLNRFSLSIARNLFTELNAKSLQ